MITLPVKASASFLAAAIRHYAPLLVYYISQSPPAAIPRLGERLYARWAKRWYRISGLPSRRQKLPWIVEAARQQLQPRPGYRHSDARRREDAAAAISSPRAGQPTRHGHVSATDERRAHEL